MRTSVAPFEFSAIRTCPLMRTNVVMFEFSRQVLLRALDENEVMFESCAMGGGGFEPPKQDAADLQSVPFGHSGNHPFQNNIMS